MRLFEKIKLINEVFADNELHSQTYKNACLEVLNKYEQQFAIHSVVGQSEQLCEGLHSTDFNGKCFKCGEQVFVREPK